MNIELSDDEIQTIEYGWILITQRLEELEEDESVSESDYEFGRYTMARRDLYPIMARLMGEQWVKDEEDHQWFRSRYGRNKKSYKAPPPPTEEEREQVRQNRLRMLAEKPM